MNEINPTRASATDIDEMCQRAAAHQIRAQDLDKAAEETVRIAEQQAAEHVAKAREQAAAIRLDRDAEAERAEYWSALAAQERERAGLPYPGETGPIPATQDGGAE